MFELLGAEVRLLNLPLQQSALLSVIEDPIKLFDFLLYLRGLLLIMRRLSAHQNLPQVLVHHLLEVVLAEDGDDERRVDL